MVPPAFAEIGQLVLQCVLKNFEHDGYYGTQPPISQYQGFQPPAYLKIEILSDMRKIMSLFLTSYQRNG